MVRIFSLRKNRSALQFHSSFLLLGGEQLGVGVGIGTAWLPHPWNDASETGRCLSLDQRPTEITASGAEMSYLDFR